jgi:hypothetical protein
LQQCHLFTAGITFLSLQELEACAILAAVPVFQKVQGSQSTRYINKLPIHWTGGTGNGKHYL